MVKFFNEPAVDQSVAGATTFRRLCLSKTSPAAGAIRRIVEELRGDFAMQEAGTGAGGSVPLPAVADLVEAGRLKTCFEQALATGMGIEVDASGVQRISSPCLQVLVAGVSAFAKAGGPSLVIAQPSEAFRETVSVLGLMDALGLK
jgi:chemotaxis protein CheX